MEFWNTDLNAKHHLVLLCHVCNLILNRQSCRAAVLLCSGVSLNTENRSEFSTHWIFTLHFLWFGPLRSSRSPIKCGFNLRLLLPLCCADSPLPLHQDEITLQFYSSGWRTEIAGWKHSCCCCCFWSPLETQLEILMNRQLCRKIQGKKLKRVVEHGI